MESVIMEDSPLADYLEGVATHASPSSPKTPPSPHDFAPKGLPARLSRLRDKLPPLKLHATNAHGGSPSAARRKRGSQIIAPGRSDFLDQFRFLIVGSQLLSGHANAQGYNPRLSLQNASSRATQEPATESYTTAGLVATAAGAFALAWFINFARGILRRQLTWWRVAYVVLVCAAGFAGLYFLARRQMVGYVRRRTIDTVTEYVDTAQTLDGASAAAVSLIQEVELVSRGYRISSPLPPVSRLEEQGQVKRCSRLRKVLWAKSSAMLRKYRESFDALKRFAVESDLEQYFDVYEVSRTDLDELESPAEDESLPESVQTLKSIKSTLQRLHIARKIFLCCLLAISSADCGAGTTQWTAVNEALAHLSQASLESATGLDAILSDDAKFTAPQTPREPMSPGHERMRTQLRKFNSLSAGIRELQAKVFLLREDSDRALGAATVDVGDVGARLLEQYDAFGADLRNLMHEWEEGRAALAANINKHEQRLSLSPSAVPSLSRSTTPGSLSGLTAASGGSPADALKILNGEVLPAVAASDDEDEELFEAVAMPRQRASVAPREERIAKMKEERVRQAAARERADASRTMVQELESVIKLRPRPGGLRTSL